MSIIYNPDVAEEKIYSAYGLNAFGKINRYIWTLYNNKEENVLITFAIKDESNHTLFYMNMGNNFITESTFNLTIDNFLYWFKKHNPDKLLTEEMVYDVLCGYNSLFNYKIENEKFKERQKEAEKIRRADEKLMYEKKRAAIKKYCNDNNYYMISCNGKILIVKSVKKDKYREYLEEYIDNEEQIQYLLSFIQKYPNEHTLKIIMDGNIDEIYTKIK